MAGIALLLPNQELMEQAAIITRKKGNHVIFVKQTNADTVVNETRNAIAKGANIVVARGHQAMEIKNYTKIPVVEIGITAQELGLTIVKAKKILKKKRPVIGIFSWEGMLCDTQYFDELFDVKIHKYLLEDTRPWGDLIDDALEDGIEFLIGGEQCVRYANQKAIPALHLSSTGESLRIAMENAENLYYMSEIEQQNYAQFSTVLDSSFNGIIKISENGTVLLMNRVMAQILHMGENEAVGMHVSEVLKGIDDEILGKVLGKTGGSYSTFINTSGQALVVVLESIQVDGRVMGAIISCNRMKRLRLDDEDTMREQFMRGNVARGSLDDLAKRYPGLKQTADLAKLYAPSSSPIFVEGCYGEEMDAVCQGIHNYSLRKDGPYVTVNLDGMEEAEQYRVLFGDAGENGSLQGGALSKANFGTFVIYHMEHLSRPAQYLLMQVVARRQLVSYIGNEPLQMLDVRLIGCTSEGIGQIKKEKKFREDLYYLLAAFHLRIPPLKARKKDVEILMESYFHSYLKLYSRYHILSPGAREIILEYPWDGQEAQLKSFCERLVLTVGKRTITGEDVRFLLREIYELEEQDNQSQNPEELENSEDRERVQIEQMLMQYHGNRALTAKALGISKTTLWRKLKKYHLD